MDSTARPGNTRPAKRTRRYWRNNHPELFDAPGSGRLDRLLAEAAHHWPHLTDEKIIERFAWEFMPYDTPDAP